MLAFIFVSPELKPNKITKDEIMNKKPNSIPSARTKADSEQKEDLFVSQYSSIPNVLVAQLRYPHDVNEATTRIIFVVNKSCKAKNIYPKNCSLVFN